MGFVIYRKWCIDRKKIICFIPKEVHRLSAKTSAVSTLKQRNRSIIFLVRGVMVYWIIGFLVIGVLFFIVPPILDWLCFCIERAIDEWKHILRWITGGE